MSDNATKLDLTELREQTKGDMKELRQQVSGDMKELRQQVSGDMKELRQQINEDIKTHTGVLYEKFSIDVKLVAEQVAGVTERLERVEQKTDALIETVADIKVELSPLRESVDNHELRIKNLERVHVQ